MKKVSRHEEKQNREKRAFAALHCAHYRQCLDKAAKNNKRLDCYKCDRIEFFADNYQKEVGQGNISNHGAGEQSIKVEHFQCKTGAMDINRQSNKQGRKIMEKHEGRRSEVGSQRSEVGGQRSEVGGQRSEVGSQRSEVGGQRSEVGSQRSEVGGQRSEVGGQRSEVGSQRSEVGGQRSEGETQICKEKDCEHAGKPQPIDDFQIHPRFGTRFKMCNSCLTKRKKAGQQKRQEKRLEKEFAEVRGQKSEVRSQRSKKTSSNLKPNAPRPIGFADYFKDHPKIYEKLIDLAEAELRTPENQMLYLLKDFFNELESEAV